MKKVMAGIDLHSNNVVIGIMDTDGKRVTSAKLPCELKEIAKFLTPFKKQLSKSRWSPPIIGIGWWTDFRG